MPQRLTRLLRSLALFLAALFVFGILALFTISHVLPPLSRAYYGSTAQVGEWRVQIPSGYVRVNDSYFSLSFGAPFFRNSDAHLSIRPLAVATSASEHRLQMALMSTEGERYVLEDRQVIRTTYATFPCFRFFDKQAPTRVTVRCLAEDGRLWVYFEGDRAFAPAIYQMLRNIERRSTTGATTTTGATSN